MEFDGKIRFSVVSEQSSILNYFKWIRRIHPWDPIVFGVEAEFNYEHQDTHESEVDVLSICTTTHECVFILLRQLPQIPDIIKNFLKAPDIIKVSFGITNHLEALQRACSVQVESAVDVRHLVDEEGFDMQNLHTLPWVTFNTHVYQTLQVGFGITNHLEALQQACSVQVESAVDVRHLVDEEGFDMQKPHTLPWLMGERTVPDENVERSQERMTKDQLNARALKVAMYARVFNALTKRRAMETYRWADWEVYRNDRMARCSFQFWSKYFNIPFDYDKSRHARKQLIDLILQLGDTRILQPPPEDVDVVVPYVVDEVVEWFPDDVY